MNIVIEFQDPGTFNYSAYKMQNYKGTRGLSYVLGAGFGNDFAPDPMVTVHDRIQIESSQRIQLKTNHFNDLNKSEIYDIVKREICEIENIPNVQKYATPNAIDEHLTPKFENLSDGESILTRAASTQQWGQAANRLESDLEHSSDPYLPISPQRESAIPNTLFKVSKKEVKKDRKVIPMKSNLKFKR